MEANSEQIHRPSSLFIREKNCKPSEIGLQWGGSNSKQESVKTSSDKIENIEKRENLIQRNTLLLPGKGGFG